MKHLISLIVVACFASAAALAADAAAPPIVVREVSYSKDVKPILAQRCYKCHANDKLEAELDMRTRESFLKGGEDGVVIVVGKSADSEVIKRVTSKDADRMPRKSDPLKAEEISILRAWIDQGFKWDDAPVKAPDKK
jgi:uncharacterized membrane protein